MITKYKYLIAFIGVMPIVLALSILLVIPALISENNNHLIKSVSDNIMLVAELFYVLNMLIMFVIFLLQRKMYKFNINAKRMIFILIPLAPIAINLTIGFNLKLKDKSFLSWGSLMMFFGWGDVYQNVKNNKIDWSDV